MMRHRLSETCPLVMAALRMRGTPAPVDQVADALCLTRAQTFRALLALTRLGLAERVDDGWRIARGVS